ncbi:MAG: hypothetical protein IH600_15125 [Bacteroidetes bacterium]|nr:hypothetical protein [Bacteroidota bacterium]
MKHLLLLLFVLLFAVPAAAQSGIEIVYIDTLECETSLYSREVTGYDIHFEVYSAEGDTLAGIDTLFVQTRVSVKTGPNTYEYVWHPAPTTDPFGTDGMTYPNGFQYYSITPWTYLNGHRQTMRLAVPTLRVLPVPHYVRISYFRDK